MYIKTIALACALFFPALLLADLPVAPYTRATASSNGIYVLVSVPVYSPKTTLISARQVMYSIDSDGLFSETWHSVGQYAENTYVSDDGIHYVQIDNPVFGQKPMVADKTLRFYARGDLI